MIVEIGQNLFVDGKLCCQEKLAEDVEEMPIQRIQR